MLFYEWSYYCMVAAGSLTNVFYRKTALSFAIIIFLSSYAACAQEDTAPVAARYKVFSLRHISADDARNFIGELDLATISLLPSPNTILVTAAADNLTKVSAIIKLIDCESHTIFTVVPIEQSDKFPDNAVIDNAIEEMSIGTFLEPPADKCGNNAIIDTLKGSLVAIVPAKKMDLVFQAVEKINNPPQERPSVEAIKITDVNTSAVETAEVIADSNDAPKSDALFESLLDSL